MSSTARPAPAGVADAAQDPAAPLSDDALVLARVSRQLATGEPLGASLTRVLDLCVGALAADMMIVYLLDPTGMQLEPAAARGVDPTGLPSLPSPGGLPVGPRLAEHCRALLAEYAELPVKGSADLPADHLLCGPIVFRETGLGFVMALRKASREAYARREHQLLTAVAAQTALAVHSGLPHEDIMTRERVERSIQFAHTLLQSLTPRAVPAAPGYRLDVRRRSSLEVAGDFYDALRLADGRLVLLVGETSGHGINAAYHITRALTSLRGLLAQGLGAAETLQALNTLLVTEKRRSVLVSVGLVFLDPEAHRYVCTRAGSITVYRMDPAGAVAPFQAGSETPLGMLTVWDFDECQGGLAPGETLMLHTDGLSGCMDQAGTPFDAARLSDCSRAARATNTPLAAAVEERLQEEACEDLVGRDITLASIERL